MDMLAYISDIPRRNRLAAELGKNPHYLWQVATRRRRASTDLALAIEDKTGGEVSRCDLRPDIWPAFASERHPSKHREVA
jgi:DNA-binding transcriptional regulator YdaS (Cro superfamily)